MKAMGLYMELPEYLLAPNSVTMASLVDSLNRGKRVIIKYPPPPVEYNCLYLMADELSAFISEYDTTLIGGLTTFYDVVPYGQERRTNDIKIRMRRPQLNILCGATPNNVIKLVPEWAWEQGFMTRVVMVYSNDKLIADDFLEKRTPPGDLIHDLKIINTLQGPLTPDDGFRRAVANWRQMGEPPVPSHPKLLHYNARRKSNLFKLSMVSSVDRDGSLQLTTADFNRAMNWLVEAEQMMPEVFQAGTIGADAKAMDELLHFIIIASAARGWCAEHLVVKQASKIVPSHSVMRVLEIMERSGQIETSDPDPKTRTRYYRPRRVDELEE